MKRIAVYVFWEKQGVVRDYVVTYLKGLTEVASKIYVVVNGEIQPQGKEKLESEIGAIVLQRPNEGVDFWAYKTALDCEGETISKYQEVILCNCSCYGPIYPFSEMFDEMGKRDVDFWGITEWPRNTGGYTGTWILSYFMVFRPSLFLSFEWKKYWENLSHVYSREECIDKHETKFTAYFADKGFKYDIYCENLPGYIDMTIEAPDKLIIDQKCPILKRKVFCTEYNRFLSLHRGDTSKRAYQYIKENNLYNTDEIIEDMLATQHLAYLHDCLQLQYILPESGSNTTTSISGSVAVFFYMHYETEFDENFKYLLNLSHKYYKYILAPERFVDILITKVKAYNLQNCYILQQTCPNSFLHDFMQREELVEKFDYICVAHDESNQVNVPGVLNGESTKYTLDSLLISNVYVDNILRLFQQNKHIGLLIPENPIHGTYFRRYGMEWGLNYIKTVEFLKSAEIDVMISQDIRPVAPLEGMLWFRKEALRPLFHVNVNKNDFISENQDGTLHHAIIRALPYISQNEGYLTGTVIPISLAENQLIGLNFLYRSANLALNNTPNQIFVPVQMDIGVKGALTVYLKKHLPPKLFTLLKIIYHKIKR